MQQTPKYLDPFKKVNYTKYTPLGCYFSLSSAVSSICKFAVGKPSYFFAIPLPCLTRD
jgi:hypothetical protein